MFERRGQFDCGAVCSRPANVCDSNGFNLRTCSDRDGIASGDAGVGRDPYAAGSCKGSLRKGGLRARFADRNYCGHLILAADVDPDLLPGHKPGGACDRQVCRPCGECHARVSRDRDEYRCQRRRRTPDDGDCARFTIDLDLLSDGKAGGIADLNSFSAGLRRSSQPGAGETEEIEAVRRQLCSRGDGGKSDRRPLALGPDQSPTGEIDGAIRGVIKLNELLGGIGGSAEAELIDLYGNNIPYPYCRCFGTWSHARSALPRSVGSEESTAGGRGRCDVKGCVDARARRNRIGEYLRGFLRAIGYAAPGCARQGDSESKAVDWRTGSVGEGGGDLLRRLRHECSDARQRNRRNVVPRGHDIGLHCVSGRFGRMARRHYSFVKSSGGAVAVIAASAQQDAALLVHRVVTSTGRRARPLSTVKGCEAALLCVAAAKVPAVAAASAGNGSYKTPGVDGGIGDILFRV